MALGPRWNRTTEATGGAHTRPEGTILVPHSCRMTRQRNTPQTYDANEPEPRKSLCRRRSALGGWPCLVCDGDGTEATLRVGRPRRKWHAAGLDCPRAVRFHRGPATTQHAGSGCGLARRLGECELIDARHHHVGHDWIPRLATRIEAVESASRPLARFDHAMPGALQEPARDGSDQRLVLRPCGRVREACSSSMRASIIAPWEACAHGVGWRR